MGRSTGILAHAEIVLESGHHSRSQRQAPVLEELRVPDVDGFLLQIDIPEAQTRDLPSPQTGAVGKHEHREEADRAQGAFGDGYASAASNICRTSSSV